MRYPIAVDTLGEEELDAARNVLASGRLTQGEQVSAFEQEFAAWTGARHAVMVNSGSSANLLAVDSMLRRSLVAPAWSAGDEVLVPALAWPTTVWPLVQLGLVPVFCDVDPVTLAIDLDSARGAMSERTKGMFLIHVLGRCPDMDAYAAFCQAYGLSLIEDVCESLGAFHNGRHAGRFGRAGTFSTYFSHHISTVEGGMLITDSESLRDDLVSARSHGWTRDRRDADRWTDAYREIDPRFLFATMGYNVRSTEISAAIGRVQLRRLDEALMARERCARNVAASCPEWLSLIGADTLSDTPSMRKARQHSWMTLPFRVRGANVSQIKVHLESFGVETRPILAGNIVRHPAIRAVQHRCASSLRVSDDMMQNGFMVGCHASRADVLFDALRELEAA